jgi:uncharacterized repeat protein (TIGR03803 family)
MRLSLASNGSFYGTTESGGSHGYGTVFRLSASGAVTTIYNFDFSHGAYSYGPLVQGGDKNLYGMASEGGSHQKGGGVVFKMTLKGVITMLRSFDGDSLTDGAYPTDGLLAGTDGNFYGSTFLATGGVGFYGTLFRIDKNPVWTSRMRPSVSMMSRDRKPSNCSPASRSSCPSARGTGSSPRSA